MGVALPPLERCPQAPSAALAALEQESEASERAFGVAEVLRVPKARKAFGEAMVALPEELQALEGLAPTHALPHSQGLAQPASTKRPALLVAQMQHPRRNPKRPCVQEQLRAMSS
mmetsp:Transcript_72586/g.200230  ORF Transcript_72586/g.200230 Transcript_72586/m.200230 type:complete len:115 (+) Transcript_72586:295-639(+)